MLSSPKSLSSGRELRHQGMGAGYKNRGRIILSSRSHDHRLYCCPKQIANYLLSKQRLEKRCIGRLESSGLSSWPSHHCCSPALTFHNFSELCPDTDPANATQSLEHKGVGGVYFISILLGTHLTLRQSNSQGPITYAWKRLSEKELTRYLYLAVPEQKLLAEQDSK